MFRLLFSIYPSYKVNPLEILGSISSSISTYIAFLFWLLLKTLSTLKFPRYVKKGESEAILQDYQTISEIDHNFKIFRECQVIERMNFSFV
jgi:hypothetical protein